MARTASARNSGQSFREWVRMRRLLLVGVLRSSHERPACDRDLGEDRVTGSRSNRNGTCVHESDVNDEELLSAHDAASFERFYLRHVEPLLGFFARRTGDPDLAADLCAETFAAALASRHRYRPELGAAAAWLYGIGTKKLADAHRRGYAERRARRRLGMERIELSVDDFARIERLGRG